MSRAKALWHQCLDGLSDQFHRCVAEQGLDLPIDLHDVAPRITDQLSIGAGIKDAVQ